MSRGYNLFNWFCIAQLLLLSFNCPISALNCYNCASSFPGSNICLPPCSQTNQNNSTCFLTRDISLEPNNAGSVIAGHIGAGSNLFNAQEKYFIYGEEAVYLNPSVAVGWDWEYGAITYGCDTNGCNNPQNINSLPNALNARIPNDTLNQWLTGDLDNSCYQCDLCLDDNITNMSMSRCDIIPCPNHACNLVATRTPVAGSAVCSAAGWHFTSSCILSREPAQVDMTIMHYIRSKTTVLYQMEATCLSDNCNNITTFKQLKNAITINPDLSCLIISNISSTTSSSSTVVPTTGSSTNRPSTLNPTTGLSTSRPSTLNPTTGLSTSRPSTLNPTTGLSTSRPSTLISTAGSSSTGTGTSLTPVATTASSAAQIASNMNFFYLISFLFFLIKF